MTKIHQQTFGKGEPIILVHGWAMHSGIWRGFAEKLAQNYQVTCIDLPGHGHSDAIDPFHLEKISEALVNAVTHENSCWLGWSLGATVALDIASRFPDRVNSLILMTGNPCFTRRPEPDRDAATQWPAMDPQVLEMFANQLKVDSHATLLRFLALQVLDLTDYKSLLNDLKTAVFECAVPGKETLNGGLELLKQADLRTALSELTMPVSAILGDRDTLVPVAVGEQMQQLLPTMKLNIINKAGHIPFLSHPQDVLAIIADFVDAQ
ncbi:MAG: pimeloyl-ACP methyl ester esterase BioH [Methylococcaceae bacterium]